jgi:hypothetical protein
VDITQFVRACVQEWLPVVGLPELVAELVTPLARSTKDDPEHRGWQLVAAPGE